MMLATPVAFFDIALLGNCDQHRVLLVHRVLTELGVLSGGDLLWRGRSAQVGLEGGWLLSVVIGLGPEWVAGPASGWTVRLQRAGGACDQQEARRVDDTDSTAEALRVLLNSVLTIAAR